MAIKTNNFIYVSGGYAGGKSSTAVFKLQFQNDEPVGEWVLAGNMKSIAYTV